MLRRLAFIAAIVTVVAADSCTVDLAGLRCNADHACIDGFFCVEEICVAAADVTPCQSDGDCAGLEVCGKDNVCVAPAVGEGEGDVVGEGEGDVVVGEGEGDVVVGEGEGDVVVGEGEGDVVVGEGEGDVVGEGEGEGDTGCGDGVLVGESCDDGNRDDNDGCSSTCTVEANAACTGQPSFCHFNFVTPPLFGISTAAPTLDLISNCAVPGTLTTTSATAFDFCGTVLPVRHQNIAGASVAIVDVRRLDFSGSVSFTGTDGVVFLVSGDARVTGSMSVVGAGARARAACGASAGENGSVLGVGGGGGALGSVGGAGGNGSAVAPVVAARFDSPRGGCPGGSSSGGVGGGLGGGFLMIASSRSLNVTGALDAGGAGGRGSDGSGRGGGGGGSGGYIVVDAPTVTVAGNAVNVTGGGGGEADGDEDGAAGSTGLNGGFGGSSHSGGDGGNGGSVSVLATGGESLAGGGGGGGGGAGAVTARGVANCAGLASVDVAGTVVDCR